jgi:hypothetical protein
VTISYALLRTTRGESAAPSDPAARADDDTEHQPSARWFWCRGCGSAVAKEDALVTVVGTGPQVYVNPHGTVFEIITFCHAVNLVGVGDATAEFTWFSAYTWRIVVCAGCAAHLGWVYDATRDVSPPRFYGLIRSKLSEAPR